MSPDLLKLDGSGRQGNVHEWETAEYSVIPNKISGGWEDYELRNSGELLWDPNAIECDELEEILERFKVEAYCVYHETANETATTLQQNCGNMLDESDWEYVKLVCVRQDVLFLEEMLILMAKCNFDDEQLRAALDKLGVNGWHPHRPHWRRWSLQEVKTFELEMANHLRVNMPIAAIRAAGDLLGRSVSDCMEFYFVWKYSSRYVAFKNRLTKLSWQAPTTLDSNSNNFYTRKRPRINSLVSDYSNSAWRDDMDDEFVNYEIFDSFKQESSNVFGRDDIFGVPYDEIGKFYSHWDYSTQHRHTASVERDSVCSVNSSLDISDSLCSTSVGIAGDNDEDEDDDEKVYNRVPIDFCVNDVSFQTSSKFDDYHKSAASFKSRSCNVVFEDGQCATQYEDSRTSFSCPMETITGLKTQGSVRNLIFVNSDASIHPEPDTLVIAEEDDRSTDFHEGDTRRFELDY